MAISIPKVIKLLKSDNWDAESIVYGCCNVTAEEALEINKGNKGSDKKE